MSLRNYDSWLEAPYQRREREAPASVEDVLGIQFWFEGERVRIEDWEYWEDADEDGRHGGVDLIVKVIGSNRSYNMSPGDVEDILGKQDEHKSEDD